jgi:universal stress protein A
MLKPTKILVPTDFSEYSDKALKQALDIAKQYNARVYLLHVVPPFRDFGGGDYVLNYEVIKAAEKQDENVSAERIKKQLEKFPQAQEVEVVTDIIRGLAYEEILKEADEKGIDLIVIASLGQSGLAKYIIGSVARNVLRGAKCPVLLTK